MLLIMSRYHKQYQRNKHFFKLKGILRIATVFCFAFFLHACIEQVDSDFRLQADIVFVDGYALTEEGESSITITKSILFNGDNYRTENVADAKVKLENIGTGEVVDFPVDFRGIYICPPEFAVVPGEQWKLHIELEGGRKIESTAQTVSQPIQIDNIEAVYSPELKYNAQFDVLAPGHSINIDWQDPADTDNFYLWRYKTYEQLFVCKTCVKGVFRNGECDQSVPPWGPDYFNYRCFPTCWQIELGSEIPIFEDRLENGANITNRQIIELQYYRRTNILVELQQLSLDAAAFEYFKVLNSQISEGAGLNAPPPAALLGNLFNPSDANDLVLGNFTAAGVSTERVYINRAAIQENPVNPSDIVILENCIGCPTTFPCEESISRTSIKPEGWP